MSSRTRRLLIGTAIVVVLLFVGRWTTEFLAERWWAATISPAALDAVTRWGLLGFALDAIAIGFASAWFVLQALAIGRTIRAVQIPRRVGNLELLEAVPTRFLLIGGIVLGVLLGWISGAGAHAWRGPVAIAWQGVTWGMTDPLLHADLGLLVARLPVWQLTLDFLLTLILLGLAFCGMLYVGIGAIQRQGRAIVIHPMARRHLGGLLMLLALAIAISYAIAPWEIAGSAETGLSLEAAQLRVRASQLFAGTSFFAAIASLLWGLGRRGNWLLVGWSVMTVTTVADLFFSPTRPTTTADRTAMAAFNDLAWGIRRGMPLAEADSVPPVTPVWDEHLLELAELGAGRRFLAATPVLRSTGTAAWLVASSDSGGREVQVRAIAEGHLTPEGMPLPVPDRLRILSGARSRPGAPDWEQATTGGVPLGNLLSKAVVAWGRQFAGVPSLSGPVMLDWHLDPSDRASAILPMAAWLPADIMTLDGRPVWVVQGLLPVLSFPMSTRQRLQGTDVAGMLPAFLAVIDVESGAMRFFLDPAASPLGTAWVDFAPGLIAPADSIPAALRDDLPYSAEWVSLQVNALLATGALPVGGPTLPAVGMPAVWNGLGAGRQLPFDGASLGRAAREQGMPTWHSDSEITSTGMGREELQRLFQGLLLAIQLRDSVRASGDSAVTGALRWWRGGGATMAWRPIVALRQNGGPEMVALAIQRQGLAPTIVRTPEAAWHAIASASDTGAASPAEDNQQLREARLWLARADSALRRGDLTAFGRYFERLQRVLENRAKP